MKRLLAAIAAICLASCGGGGGGDAPADLRTEAAGIIDASFGVQGLATFPGRAAAGAVAELDDGSLLVGGDGPYLAKLTSGGNPDFSFASAGVDAVRRGTKVFQVVEKIEVLSADRIAVLEGHYNPCGPGSPVSCGVQTFRDVVARRIDSRGNPDLAYGSGGVAILPSSQGSLVVSPDGRVTSFINRAVIAGIQPFAVASLDPAGMRDAAFETRASEALQRCGGTFTPAATDILSVRAARSGSGFIVAALWSSGTCVARLNADGTLDPSFANAGFQTFVHAPRVSRVFRTFVRADGGITVALHSVLFNTFELPMFLFLTATGAKDTASAPGGVQAQPIIPVALSRDVALQPNGKVITTGVSSVAAGVPTFPLDEENPRITRSTANAGTFDASFGPVRGGYMPLRAGDVALLPRAIAFGRDGSIYVVGSSAGTGAILKIR